MNKSKIEKRQDGTADDSSTKADLTTSNQTIAKPLVVRSPSPLSPELLFARKMYLCVQLLGGQSDILATIGSWRTDVSDEETFGLLDCWIDATIEEQTRSLNYVKKSHSK